MTIKEVLKRYFGYDSFKRGQEEIMEGILKGRDVLAVMPTGAGKSLCYQIPAMVLPGLTLVISPLISLMQDQVKVLREAGIEAGYINSSLSEEEIGQVYERARQGEYKLLYVAPERLSGYSFLDFAREAEISMVTVDEAHCISQWGQDFRPSYLKILDFIKNLPGRPVVSAFTATATPEVKEDISRSLTLRDPLEVATGFDRENLFFEVKQVKKKEEFILSYIREHPQESGIVYCATRKNVEKVYEHLWKAGISVARYHAGMDNEERKASQDDFIYDRSQVVVATNAFGMGIDKSNVRFVIHYNMPQSMENYYQEAGRGGRDGEEASCILLFSPQDIRIDQFLLDHKDFSDVSPEEAEILRERDEKRLRVMEGYCRTSRCLRSYILSYFGERREGPCNKCSNCQKEFDRLDKTWEAKKVINCVYESRGRYGVKVIMGTLRGKESSRLKELGTTGYRTYGVLKDMEEGVLRALIDQMIQEGYLLQTGGQYSLIQLGDIQPLKREDTHVVISIPRKEKEEEVGKAGPRRRGTTSSGSAMGGEPLFEALRLLRLSIARREHQPPYIIFNDRTLMDMCQKLPQNREEMLEVSGVGERKFEKYGKLFLEEIERFQREQGGK